MTPARAIPVRFNLADYLLFDRLREGLGAKPCLRFGRREYTYADVARRTRAFEAALETADVRRGERVLVVLPDVPPLVWTLFGALARGCVVALASPDAPSETIDYLVQYTGATAMVTVPRVLAGLRDRSQGAGRRGLRRVWCTAEPAALSGLEDPESDTGETDGASPLSRALAPIEHAAAASPPHRDEPAIWLFTSGSGEPKANVHSHRDFAFSAEAYAKGTIGFIRADVTVSVPRLSSGYALGTNLLFPFAVGATVGLFSERPTPETLARAFDLYKPSIVTNVPTMLGKLLEYDSALCELGRPGLDLSCVRFSLSAGEALSAALLRRWLRRFGSDVYDGIGSAEMFHIYATNRPGDVKPGSLGKPVEGYEIRILPQDAEGPGARPVPPGEIGVLWVKGDSVGQGYWLDRDKSWGVFHGHWCRTGDLFRVDADGYLYFAGRADDLLKVSGLWVAPVEVEQCLMEHHAVLHAEVVGLQVDGLVTTRAFVKIRAGLTSGVELAAELKDFVRSRLAKHKCPRDIEFVDELPRTARGKIDRRLFRADLGAL